MFVWLFQAHCLKATALIKAGRNYEALQEYLVCLALKPDCTKVKLEDHKVREAPLKFKKKMLIKYSSKLLFS